MALKPWRVEQSREALRTPWFRLRADSCVAEHGVRIEPYYVLEAPDSVHVAAFDAAGRLLVTRQYRHAGKTICWELPCGEMMAGEAPERAAARELLEETGCRADSIEQVAVNFADPARTTSRVHSFLAQGASVVQPPELDASENIEFEFLPLRAVFERIADGSFCQSFHVATLFLVLQRLGRLRPEL